MINSKISLGKVIKLWLPIFFWSIILFGTLNLFYLHSFSVNNLIKSIFPILFNQYWFMTVYFFMYCMVPLLNIVVNSLDNLKKDIVFYCTWYINCNFSICILLWWKSWLCGIIFISFLFCILYRSLDS